MLISRLNQLKVEDLGVELVDTPSYDSYFTLLPIRNISVHGYILMFSLFNSEVAKNLAEMRHKLFQISGQHYPTVILANTFQLYGINDSNNFSNELEEVKNWCQQTGLSLFICDIKNAKDADLCNLPITIRTLA